MHVIYVKSIHVYIAHSTGLVVALPVIEVEVAGLTSARYSFTNHAWKTCMLNFKFGTQVLLQIHNILNTATFKTTNKTTPPHNNRPKWLLLIKLAPISA